MKSTSAETDAIALFNDVKDAFACKIEELNNLKREVSKTEAIDQQQKSKLRITIESLLIDLNEEIFSISEELAKSYTFERQKNIYQKAKDFDLRKKQLLKKIKESIDENPSVKLGKEEFENSNGFTTSERLQIAQRRKESPKNSQSTKNALQRNHTFNEVFSSDHSSKQSRQGSIVTQQQEQRISKQRSIKKQKSPIPLRRKEEGRSQSVDRKRSNSKGRKQQPYSAKKQLFSYDELPKSGRNNKGFKTVKNSKKLDEFEKYLAMKTGKENYKPEVDNKPDPLQLQYSTMLQSEAFELFAQDFAHMKNKILQMQHRLDGGEDKTKTLEEEVEKLKTENVKLATDVKIIRSEHSEIMHSLYSLEKKNTQLQAENQVLKRIVQGERDIKGQETNMPKPYIEPTQHADQSYSEIQQNRSPFHNALTKNRSLSHLRESKDEVMMGTQQFNQHPSTLEYKSRHDFQQPSHNQEPSYNQVRSSLKNWPHQNTLLSNSQERQVSQSFTHHQPPLYQAPSGQQSKREDIHHRIADTPTTPGYKGMMMEDTPLQYKREGEGSRPRSFIQQQNKGYGGSQQKTSVSVIENANNLSDWVLERINKK